MLLDDLALCLELILGLFELCHLLLELLVFLLLSEYSLLFELLCLSALLLHFILNVLFGLILDSLCSVPLLPLLLLLIDPHL